MSTVMTNHNLRRVSSKRTNRFARLALAISLIFCLAAILNAGTPSWYRDKLYGALNSAEDALSKGTARETVISNLTAAISVEPNSRLVPFTQSLIADLQATTAKVKQLSFEKVDIRQHPEKYLAETRLESSRLGNHQNWRLLDRLIEANPDDPACLILKQGRPAIEKLIESLTDPSITRTRTGIMVNWSLPNFMRVREAGMIEHLSGCDFLLRQRKSEDYARIIPHLREWWSRNKNRSREDGIRDELDRAYTQTETFDHRHSGLIWMARNLAASDQPIHAEYGENVLEDMVKVKRSMDAAETLAKLGSHRPLEVLKERFATSKSEPSRVFNRSEMFFLMQYGGREEWEMIYKLAAMEINAYGQVPELNDGPNRIGVLPVLVEEADRKPLWVVPCLALALNQTNLQADAVESLENITGEKFGFQRAGSMQSRQQAAQRAADWWERKGRSVYSVDKIATLWQKMSPTEQVAGTGGARRRPITDQIVPDGLYAFSWKLKRNERAPASPQVLESTGEAQLVVRVVKNEVVCVSSSNPACLGAKGRIESEGQGRFGFQLRIDGYEGLSHRWIARIDGGFKVEDRDGTAIVTPVGSK